MSHRFALIGLLPFGHSDGSCSAISARAVRPGNRFDQASLELHAETQAELLQFIFDLVQR